MLVASAGRSGDANFAHRAGAGYLTRPVRSSALFDHLFTMIHDPNAPAPAREQARDRPPGTT